MVHKFEDLPEQLQTDLLTFYNRRTVTDQEKQKLYHLYLNGNFNSWNCTRCGSRCYKATPTDWRDFQAVIVNDYLSYPGHNLWCDNCRMYESGTFKTTGAEHPSMKHLK